MSLSAESDGDEEIFLGVTATSSNRAKRRRRDEPPPSSAHLYKRPNEHPPEPLCMSADEEQAMMAAMGLPTRLVGQTAELNGDDYSVVASDPSLQAAGLAVGEHNAHRDPAGECEQRESDAGTQDSTVSVGGAGAEVLPADARSHAHGIADSIAIGQAAHSTLGGMPLS
jgi:hypothetical protein